MRIETDLLSLAPIAILLGACIAILHLALLCLSLKMISMRQNATGILLRMSLVRILAIVLLLYFAARHLDANSLMLLFASFIAMRMILVPMAIRRKILWQN